MGRGVSRYVLVPHRMLVNYPEDGAWSEEWTEKWVDESSIQARDCQ
jgi:hypothetical protein